MIKNFLLFNILLVSLLTSSQGFSYQCEVIEAEEIENIVKKEINDRLSTYPWLLGFVARSAKGLMYRNVLKKCAAGKCSGTTKEVLAPLLFLEIHQTVDRLVKPYRWSYGATLAFTTMATGYMATMITAEGPWSVGAKIGLGFITLAQTAALIRFQEPLRATWSRWSYEFFGPGLSPYSDGQTDARGRGLQSKENRGYYDIATRWKGGMSPHEQAGWFRYWGLVGNPNNARATISSLRDGFQGKMTEQSIVALASRTAEFMFWARRLPGAIPFDNPDIMMQLREFLWPTTSQMDPRFFKGFAFTLMKQLERMDPHFEMKNQRTTSYLYYQKFLEAWKLDGSPVPQEKINILPAKGQFEIFDQMIQREVGRQKEQGTEKTNKEIEAELSLAEAREKQEREAAEQTEIENQANETQPNEMRESPEVEIAPETGSADLADPAGE